jgi:tetratricopeptide (TPR) repeat protein
MRAHLVEVLTETGGNISQTAVRLGVARNTVIARMVRFGLRSSGVAAPARPRRDDGPRRDDAAGARVDTSPRLVPASRSVWEPRRVALLRVDVVDDAGTMDASRALDAVTGKVHAFGGEVAEMGRGALVAAFGLETVEDAPVRAALAALAILKATERARVDGRAPRVKIGVHVAPVLVSQYQGAGIIDLESKRVAWTTIESLVALDAFDTIVVSEGSAPFLERRFELAPASTADPRAVPFRRLVRRERTGFGLAGRPLSPFVGRDHERRLVADRLASAARGQGQVVGIVGEPGVGKSRFVYELTRLDAMRDWRVLGCSGVSHGAMTPFLPVADLVRRYFAIEDVDGPDVIREKVTDAVLSRHEELASCLTPLLSLLDIAVDDPSWSSLDPPRQRQRIQDAAKRLLLGESRIQPLLLVVEDLHWIDAATQAWLDGLVESLPRARLLLLINYRPEYQQRWGSKTYYSQLRLDALPPESAADLVHALLGDDPGLGPLERLLVERGNPFVIEESALALAETGALIGERGAYRLTRSIDTIEVPATVQVILAARIERLAPDDRQLLQTASVIGKDVPVVLLHAVTDAGEDEVQRGLARLRAAEFLYETRLSPDAEYTFKHALTHEVGYGTLRDERRRDLHARIVGAIERVYPDRLTEHVERLAHHARQGELWDKAVTYLHQAGLKALARSVNSEAVSYFEQALVALGYRPTSRAVEEWAIDLRCDLHTALYPLGALDRAIEYLREAEGLARTLDDQRRLARLSVHMCHMLGRAGQPMQAIAVGEDARARAESLEDVPLQVTGQLYLGTACYISGDCRRTEAVMLRVLRLLEPDRTRDRFGLSAFPAVTTRTYLALALADRGEFERGISHGQDGVRLAEELDHPYSLAAMLWGLSYLHMLRGDAGRAIAPLERGLAVSRAWSLTYLSVLFAGALGRASALLGRPEEGLPPLEQALSGFEAMGNRGAQLLFLVYLGEAYVLADRRAAALDFAERAVALTREVGQRGDEATALRLLGEVTARQDPSEHAEGHYREALALAEELEMRPLIAHCHLGLGKLHGRAGARPPAQEHLIIATRMYREMGMTSWLEQAKAERQA